MPSLSNEYTELQRSLNEQLSSGGLIEFEGNFYRFQEYDAMRSTPWMVAYFSPMTWKEFHSYWSNPIYAALIYKLRVLRFCPSP